MLVSVYKMADVGFNTDYENQYFFKTYDEMPDVLPLSLMMRVRDRNHYLEVESRVLSPTEDIRQNAQLLICKVNAYGLMGTCLSKDRKTGNIKVGFNKNRESAKVHDPFLGQKAIQQFERDNSEAANKARQFFGEQEIDVILQVPSGVTAAMTSQFMVKYRCPEKKERVLVDIGLNIKSW